MNWVFIFLGFCALIVLHEMGHFTAAKAVGMPVQKAFLFFGPTLWSVKRGETEYGVKTIPLGGYVKINGMNPEEEVPDGVDPARLYYRQPVWKRIVVIAAGPAVNIVLAFVILFFVAFGYPQISTTIGSVKHESAAAAAGIAKGEKIVAVDGKSYPGASSEERAEHFGKTISSHECAGGSTRNGCKAATPVKLTLEQPSGTTRQVSVFPTYDSNLKRMLVGVDYATESPVSSAGEASSFAGEKMWLVTSGTAHVFSHIFEAKERKQLSGVVGTSNAANEAINVGGASLGFLILALVSLSLGLINLLPFLPLDGGHIFWALVEKVRGAPVSLRVMEGASVIGFALVAILFVLGLSNDIGRLNG